jgi:hypothetical protein
MLWGPLVDKGLNPFSRIVGVVDEERVGGEGFRAQAQRARMRGMTDAG